MVELAQRTGRPLGACVEDVEISGQIVGVTFCLMIATTLHSVAVGNLLPAWVKVVCVDINPPTFRPLQSHIPAFCPPVLLQVHVGTAGNAKPQAAVRRPLP